METNLSTEQSGDFPSDAEKAHKEEEKARINEMVHRVLIIGLVISTSLMLIGIGLDLVEHRETPTQSLDVITAFQQVADLHPAGFLTLGILVLIATPILRVLGSIIAFIYERDWRYALITFIVFSIVMVSIISGKG